MAYWNTQWTDADVSLLQVVRGEPAGQARLEAFTLLVALATWRVTFTEAQGNLAVLGDALGVLHDVVKLKARDRILNAVAGEMALVLAPISLDIRAAHLWTQRNAVCDALSRLAAGQEHDLPALKGAIRVRSVRPKCDVLRSLEGS